MEIGSIGAGAFAEAFASRALKAGHKVKLSNNRGPDSLRESVNRLGPGAMAATKEEAAACEMVPLAVPWDNVPGTLSSLSRWKNQILIDGTNPFHGKAGKFTPADVGNLSTSQLVAALAPGARVVKAFNHMIVPDLEKHIPVVNGARRVAFVSADNDDAKKRVETLLESFRVFGRRSWQSSRWRSDPASRWPSRRPGFFGKRTISQMKAIHLTAYGNPAQNLRMVEVRNQTRRVRARRLCAWSMRRLPTAISFWRTGCTLKPKLPSVIGGEGAGIVEAVGPGVTSVKAGDRVTIPFGTFTWSEKVLAPAKVFL